MTEEHFETILDAAGFDVLKRKDSPKIAHFALKKRESFSESRILAKDFAHPAPVMQQGKGRIDFSICFHSGKTSST